MRPRFGRSGRRPRQQLVRLLQFAYSGELGAALAYRGHAASVADLQERCRISEIRGEELDHRQRVGCILHSLDGQPDPLLEMRNCVIGTAIALLCHVGGWFLPMYGAGWIERRNLDEYVRAARLGMLCGEEVFVDELLAMAEVELEHEGYFRLKAASHPLSRLLKVWAAPPPREELRRAFPDGYQLAFASYHQRATPLHFMPNPRLEEI